MSHHTRHNHVCNNLSHTAAYSLQLPFPFKPAPSSRTTVLFSKLNPFTMYHSVEDELLRATHLLIELSEQNEHNFRLSTNLQSIAGSLKVCPSCPRS